MFKANHNDMTYIKSEIDNHYYLVRNEPDKLQAANILATIKKNMFIIMNYLVNNIDKYKDNYDHIKQLQYKIKDVIIIESTENSVYTSYSVNKGEQIVFCVRSRKNKDEFHDLNLMMYVVLHEMSHVACPEYGHTPLFKKIFAFITNIAIELNLYTKIPFDTNPQEYCGMTITDSIV
jgi:predicted metal-dependent hydrolase